MRVSLFALGALCATSLATAQSYAWHQCPTTGKVYAVTQPVTWQQGRTLAQLVGGDLAVVTSAAEHDWLYATFGGIDNLWIGLTDQVIEGSWHWVTGNPSTYTNWASGNPTFPNPLANWATISSTALAGGRWVDRPSSVLLPAILEIDLSAAGRAVAVGDGCAGSNGTPLLTAATGVPIPGASFTLQLSQLPQSPTTEMVAFGLRRSAPLDLGQFGMPSCVWQTEQFYFAFVNSTGGSAQLTYAVINNPILRGVRIYTQAAVFDLPANALGATVSNALSMVYGAAAGEVAMTENFLDAAMLDRDRSGGDWSNGQASFAAIGGDGVLGTFDHTLGTHLGIVGGLDTYEFDTTTTVIPAANTLTGSPIAVTDGVFAFDTMVVPAGVRVRFVGAAPAHITVAGRIRIDGEVDVQGESLPYPPLAGFLGQDGGRGGAFGGRGGKGGDRCLGTGALPSHQGGDGSSAQLLVGRAYANTAAGTGGRGSTLFPASGLNTGLYFGFGIVTYTPTACAGGGGGGLWTAGTSGVVVGNNFVDPVLGVPPLQSAMGPAAAGGSAVQFFPFPPTAGSSRSSLHFLVGGAGGGAAASNAALAINVAPGWAAGCGGGGGGGALALRAGDAIDLAVGGALRGNGGSGANAPATGTAAPAPGGGGSGGTIVLQSGRATALAGTIDVRGGLGGTYFRTIGTLPPNGAAVQIAGGNGGEGFVRLELPGTPTTALLATMQPPPVAQNVASLTESDVLVSATSRPYDTGLSPSPRYLRYEIDAVVDGVPVRFSDDPTVSPVSATTGSPLRALFQGADLDPATGQVVQTGPWHTAVRSAGGVTGLDADRFGAFRFRLVHDRSLAATVVVRRVQVVYDASR